MGVCNCSMFCCMLLYVYSSIAITLMGKRELIALLNLSSWCLMMVERLFLAVPRGCLQFVIVVFPDHTHLLFLVAYMLKNVNRSVPLNISPTEFGWILKDDWCEMNFFASERMSDHVESAIGDSKDDADSNKDIY